MQQLTIVGIAGSLRRASYSRGLVRAAAEVALAGIAIETFELGAIPLFNQDVEDAGEPGPVVAFDPRSPAPMRCSWRHRNTTTACPGS